MEIFDIVDENGNPTGQTIERSGKVAGAFAETCADEGFLPR